LSDPRVAGLGAESWNQLTQLTVVTESGDRSSLEQGANTLWELAPFLVLQVMRMIKDHW
jgi:hypothetical protein